MRLPKLEGAFGGVFDLLLDAKDIPVGNVLVEVGGTRKATIHIDHF